MDGSRYGVPKFRPGWITPLGCLIGIPPITQPGQRGEQPPTGQHLTTNSQMVQLSACYNNLVFVDLGTQLFDVWI